MANLELLADLLEISSSVFHAQVTKIQLDIHKRLACLEQRVEDWRQKEIEKSPTESQVHRINITVQDHLITMRKKAHSEMEQVVAHLQNVRKAREDAIKRFCSKK